MFLVNELTVENETKTQMTKFSLGARIGAYSRFWK
jgi:hypothetical protein